MSVPTLAPFPQVDRTTPLGATVVSAGVTLRTWAPAARQVFALTGASLAAARGPGFAPAASDACTPLGDGTWGAFLPGTGEGARYMFWVAGTGSTGLKRDPRARELTANFPASDCLARSPFTYPWHDQAFQPAEFRDLILYQLHAGVFYAVDTAGNDNRSHVAKFLDILDRVDYLRDLGVNAVQLLPIQEFPGESSRGYNGLDLFSPEMLYQVDDVSLSRYVATANSLLAVHGKPPVTADQLRPGPNQLKCVIDIFHLSVMTIHRWIEGQGEDVLVAINLQEFNRSGYRIGFPGAGAWREIFNSDYYEQFPNPSVVGNNGSVTAEGVPWDGMPASAEIAIPANGFVVFAR